MVAPLTGIRVLDFTRYQQGPFASVMLGDMGADVVKVEDPAGEFGRRMWKEPDGFSAFYESMNRGKRSICIDLRKPGAAELILELVPQFDVVMENFRPGTMDRWGVGYDALRGANPKLVYGQATGWGTRGPRASDPSFDQIAQAFSGYAMHSGGGPGHTPEISYPGIADQTGAMNFAFGIVTALLARERTGIGQKVEVSLYGTQLAAQAPELLHVLHFGQERPREFRAAPTVGHYKSSDDQWVMFVGIDQKFWPRLCRALGLADLEHDPRFARGFARWTNRSVLEPIIEQAFAERTADEWLARLHEADVPASIVQDYAAVADDEQARANDYIVEQEHPTFGPQRVIGLHVQLSETPGAVGAPAPDLGVHSREVLQEAGLPHERIDALIDAGVVLARTKA
jgi:crotonobetainyl-CoA:carnitine CoA-transferase CaiB-like acyl-CoA transferase